MDKAIQPGLTSLNWTSLNIEKYLNDIDKALGKKKKTFLWHSHPLRLSECQSCCPVSLVDLELLLDRVNDLVEYRIESVLQEMSSSMLCVLPQDEPVSCEDFVRTTRVNHYTWTHTTFQNKKKIVSRFARSSLPTLL